MIVTHVIDDWDNAVPLRTQWNELLGASSSNQPTLSFDWIANWWAQFGALENRQLRILTIEDEGQLIGIAPLQQRRVRKAGALPVWKVELLASGEPEEHEICSDYLGLISREGYEDTVAECVVEELLKSNSIQCDELELVGFESASPANQSFLTALEASGFSPSVVRRQVCNYIDLPDSWDSYLSGLSSSRRYRVRRSLRDFEAWSDDTAEIHCVTDQDSLEEGFEILKTLHAERWASENHEGVFASDLFSDFHHSIAQHLLEENQLDLNWLTVRDVPIAALYSIVWDGHVHFFQAGRKMSFPSAIRPGIVIHAYGIKRAIERGDRKYDFLAGESRYKSDLSNAQAELQDIVAYHPVSVGGRTSLYAEKIGRTLRGLKARVRA